MTNEYKDTLPPMKPDAILKEAVQSALVATVTPLALPAVAPPIVSPLSVTVTDALAATPPLTIVITTAVAEGWPETHVALPPLMATTGVAVEAKKPDGYDRVMLSP